MIPRQAADTLRRLMRGFPVVTVTGPRQSGKTTLVRAIAADRPYVSLESPREKDFALSDPHGFIHRFPDGAVIDEVQNAPRLLSELQTLVDADSRMGLFVLSGSQNMSLMAGISQSLAGRNAVMELLPLSLVELRDAHIAIPALPDMLVRGSYPALYSREVVPADWLDSYVLTYIERDARQLSAIHDLALFQRFVRLTATRTAQLLNVASLAADAGVAEKTARNWLSILEACYIVHFLRPHLSNFGKRLVKMPKLYFHDVGLAATLLGIRDASQLEAHPARGALFENLVVGEFIKARRNAGLREQLHFWRDNIGTEVDLILERGAELGAVEIKSGSGIGEDAFRSLNLWRKYAGSTTTHLGLVYGGEESYTRSGVSILSWRSL